LLATDLDHLKLGRAEPRDAVAAATVGRLLGRKRGPKGCRKPGLRHKHPLSAARRGDGGKIAVPRARDTRAGDPQPAPRRRSNRRINRSQGRRQTVTRLRRIAAALSVLALASLVHANAALAGITFNLLD
jgi:hypothetical protein